MIEIQAAGLVKSFEVGRTVLNGLTFQIERGERVGVLGANGAGKTTLFRILTGELDADEGTLVLAPGRRLGLISQIPVYPPAFTVEDVLRSAFGRLDALARELRDLEARMEAGDSGPEVLRRYDDLSQRFGRFGGYDTEVAVNKVANGLSITPEQRRQPFGSLSGGEQTRVNLGRLILEDTDVLLLDEPTNHLDLRATEWLEAYLDGFRGTVLTISHDRYFLDRAVRRIMELQGGKAAFYSGNYSFYAVEKARREQEQLRRYEKEQAEIGRLTETARRMHEHNTELLHRRAFSIEKRVERMRTAEKPVQARKLGARFQAAEFHGDEVLSLRGLSMAYGERTLFSDVSLKIQGGERVALIGDNGAGKSTLLNILMGETPPKRGSVRFAPQTKPAYLPQRVEFACPDWNLVETLTAVRRDLSVPSARNLLARYAFTGEDVFKPVSALSGGERSRLRLCMLMDGEVNLLILDEPTNHLDIASREWIEEAVEAYDGALLFVSHDRYFIQRFATRIWELADGAVTDYPMGFAQYRELKRAEAEAAKRPASAKADAKSGKRAKAPERRQSVRRRLELCERDVAKAEARLTALDGEIQEAARDYARLTDLMAERETVQAALDDLYGLWEQLSEEAEEEGKQT